MKKDQKYYQKILIPPLLIHIIAGVELYLTSKLGVHPLAGVKNDCLSIKWSPSSYSSKWLPLPTKSSIKDNVKVLEEKCRAYRSLLPFDDDKAFLDWCFNARSDSSAVDLLSVYVNKLVMFSIVSDESYLGVALLDYDEEIRELAKILLDSKG